MIICRGYIVRETTLLPLYRQLLPGYIFMLNAYSKTVPKPVTYQRAIAPRIITGRRLPTANVLLSLFIPISGLAKNVIAEISKTKSVSMKIRDLIGFSYDWE